MACVGVGVVTGVVTGVMHGMGGACAPVRPMGMDSADAVYGVVRATDATGVVGVRVRTVRDAAEMGTVAAGAAGADRGGGVGAGASTKAARISGVPDRGFLACGARAVPAQRVVRARTAHTAPCDGCSLGAPLCVPCLWCSEGAPLCVPSLRCSVGPRYLASCYLVSCR